MTTATAATPTLRIVGVDPGSRVTGYGVIDVRGSDLRYVVSGCIRARGATHIERLADIFEGLGQVVSDHRPDELALEEVFVSRNANSAIKLGQARATALCAALPVIDPTQVFEYTPRAVKQATVGYGAAVKDQVQHMVKQLLGLRGALAEDAADALAIAVCHAHTRRSRLMARTAAGGRRGAVTR